MAFVTGLKAVQEIEDARPKNEDFDKPKAKYVTIKNDGDSVKITPLQEIDEGSPNYNKENGVVIFSLQHSGKDAFWNKQAECTAEEGDCYGCAQGWYQKTVLYANVLVDDGENAPYVAILNKGIGKNSIAQSLVNMAADADYDHSITDKTFKLTRHKTGTDTTYSLDILPKAKAVDVTKYTDQLFDLPKYVFHVSPEHQENYYNGLPFGKKAAEAAPAAKREPVSAGKVDNDW